MAANTASMSSIVSSRRFRLLAALAAAAVICMIYYNLDADRWRTPPEPKKEYTKDGRLKEHGFPSGTVDMSWGAHPVKQLENIHAQFHEDAHRMADANDFLPHFKAVTQLPGITLSQARDACHWADISRVNFQYGDNNDWVIEDRPEDELALRRSQWQDFISSQLYPWHEHQEKFSGRGVAILTGNEKSLYRTKVTLGMMARLGSKLPVEIHYWGKEEINSTKKADLSALYPNIYFNDLSGAHNSLPTNHDNVFNVNYQMKPISMLNSRFAEVLFLDSDNVPVIDPELLFESDVYKEYGSVFWPDIARTRPQNPMWAITNTPCRANEYENESGQILVNKKKFWYHLQLAAWYNNVHGSYYNEFMLGDKDLFRFAWHALKTEYGRPAKWVTSVGFDVPSNPEDPHSQMFFCGHTFAQHHPAPNGSVAFFHGGLLKQIAPETLKWHISQRGGIYQAYKRIPNDEDPLATTHVDIKFDGNGYLPKKWLPPPGVEMKTSVCTDYYDVQPRPLDELVSGFQDAFLKLGGYWKIGFY